MEACEIKQMAQQQQGLHAQRRVHGGEEDPHAMWLQIPPKVTSLAHPDIRQQHMHSDTSACRVRSALGIKLLTCSPGGWIGHESWSNNARSHNAREINCDVSIVILGCRNCDSVMLQQ